MPTAGPSQVTCVAPCCLQLKGGSLPFASALWFASMRALIRALADAFGWADMDDVAVVGVWDPDPPRTRAQVPAPAAIRTRAARTASQRDRGNRRRGPGRAG